MFIGPVPGVGPIARSGSAQGLGPRLARFRLHQNADRGVGPIPPGVFAQQHIFVKPSRVSDWVNSVYATTDTRYYLEFGWFYANYVSYNPMAFVHWRTPAGEGELWFDGTDLPLITFTQGEWPGFELMRRRNSSTDSTWEVRLYRPSNGTFYHEFWFYNTGITSVRALLGCERYYNVDATHDPNYGSWIRAQYRPYQDTSGNFYFWPWGAYAQWFTNQSWDAPPWNFFLNHINDSNHWIYCNTTQKV